VVYTNLDCLHRRSGILASQISEIHGNCYKEICRDCGKQYLRSFNVLQTRTDRWTYLTYRQCSTCGGELRDTIAHFTENIDENEYEISIENARKADLALILGTSMFVQPAASLPYMTLNNPGGEIYIVNLQCTPIDQLATAKIYTETDHFMKLLMKELDIEKFDTTYDHVLTLINQEKSEEFRKNLVYYCKAGVTGALSCGLLLMVGYAVTKNFKAEL